MVLMLSEPKDNMQPQVNILLNQRSRCCVCAKATLQYHMLRMNLRRLLM
ncbi:hypothetical protein PR048_017086 [Dryococelus australis]|uniref:Uncharacterized protein n=1 Tax=Dryococelus australis TaxID=614101 RepID=A0ABQ9H8M5_9NEOP|nr:hypothetical protein PR048_017086 [Dryococelus australis]